MQEWEVKTPSYACLMLMMLCIATGKTVASHSVVSSTKTLFFGYLLRACFRHVMLKVWDANMLDVGCDTRVAWFGSMFRSAGEQQVWLEHVHASC